MSQVAIAPLFDLSAFSIPTGSTHVCAGGETPPLNRHVGSFSAYLRDKANGMPGRAAQNAVVERVRERIGAAWHVAPGEIGFVGNVAEGICMVFESIEWRDGDNVCVDGNEYPSVAAPFFAGGRGTPEVRLARGTGPDRLLEQIDARTRVVAVSHVSYLNGERFDLKALRTRTDEVGALLVVDFSQAAGYLPIEASVADFAFCACYKWLLGITGCAIAYWNTERQPHWRPATAGWHSLADGGRPTYPHGLDLRVDALRFSRGNPSHASVYVLDGALEFLDGYRVEDIQSHVQALTVDLHDRLTSFGVTPSTPRDPRRHGASICIDGDFDPSAFDETHRSGLLVWAGQGRLRVSFHGYNQRSELDAVFAGILRVMQTCSV